MHVDRLVSCVHLAYYKTNFRLYNYVFEIIKVLFIH